MTELEKMIAEFDKQNGTVKTQLSTDNSTPETTDLASMIAEFDRQNANLSDDKQEKVPTESPKTNEWGEPVYSFEKSVEVEGARLNDFLTPTIFEQKSNAKLETELPKAIKEDKPYNPEGLLPIAKPGPAEMPQSFTSPKVFKEFAPEEKLMLDVDKATDNAFNAAQEEATKQMVAERKERGTFGVMDEFGEGAAEKIAYRQRAGADAVIKRTFESISADDINTLIENKVANNEEFKAKKQAFDDEVKRIMPNGSDNLSESEIEALFANMTPEEREVAEKQIAETTQALEALQAQFASDVEAIYKSESKDVEAQINNRIINRLAKLNLPKNDLEYIGKAIYNNSLVGTLYEMGLNAAAGGSGADYVVSQQALAQAKPSAVAKVVGGAGAILADGAIFGALGAGGSLAGAGMRNLATKIVAGQIARKAAVSATNTAVKATAKRIVEQNVLQQFASSAAAQAVTLGGYNGLLTAAQETLSPTGENGAYNWRNILTRFGEGLLTGIALGGVSVGTSAAKGAMYRARPDMAYTATGMAADLGVSLAGFTAENAAFLGIGSIVSGEEIGESFATLGLLKGIGALKRVAKGEKLMQQPDFVERTISDLKFTKEEMDAMRNAGVDMEAMDFISLAVTEMNNVPYTESRRSVINAYNTVMASREIPTSAKVKLKYIVTGEVPRVVGPSRAEVVEGENGVEVRTYDYQDRVVQIRPFENTESATKFVSRIQPLLEQNTIVDGAKTLRGADSLIAIDRAIDEYMQTGEYFAEREKAYGGENTGSKLPAKTPLGKEALMREMRIYLGIEPGTLPEGAESRIARIVAIAKNVYQDSVSALQKQVAKQHGTTVSELEHALNIKPDLRTVRESQLVKAYVDGLKQFNESMSGPVEAEQARYAEQVRPQIEQGKREVEDAERETAFVRESLNEAAKRMATADGKQIAIVRLENGEQVAVHTGRIVLREDGTIDHKASEQTIVIKRIDAEGNEQRDSVGIDDIAEVIEQGTPEEAVETSMSVLEAQATKKLSLDKALSENGEQGVEVVAIDGTRGKVVGIDENGAYILRAKGESGKEVYVPVSINDIEAINAEQPATTEQAAVADAVEKVVEDAATEPVEVVYDDDFPPLTEADMAPQLDADKIQWEKLSPEDYTSASAMLYGDATTLADSHIYHTNSRAKLAKAKQSVAEQQKVIDKLNSRFATLSSPAEAQKLRKQVAAAEQEKAKREQAVKNIEQQMSKYAYAMKKYGVEVATEDSLLAERARLEEERKALLEADKELDRYEQEKATKGKKTIANTEANRKYIEQLYAGRFGVSPAQAGPRQAILWDLANGAIKLRWDNVTTDSGAVQRGLQAELGVRGTEERRAYKAVIDNKNGQSIDAYVHDLWQSGKWGQEISTEELKDELLAVLQSTPNGSLALKELADMSGVQADLEAQISLGKGDIQRKLEEVDANLAYSAQQMADFRKRINDTVQKLESGEPLILPIGEGEFGPIYDQFKGKPQEAVDFLLSQKNGEAIGALTHPEIGDVSLVYGNEFAGLEKIAQKHPEVLNDLQNVLSQMGPIMESANRIKLESPSHFAVVSKEYMGAPRDKWLLTAYEKKSSASNNRMDTDGTVTGRRNDTATSQDTTYSESKDTTTIPENQISEKEIFGNAPANEDIPFMIEQKTADKGVLSEAEQNFEREVFDAFAGHLGETLGAESVVTDAAEAQRVLEWHQAVGEKLRTAVRENAEITAERAEIERVAKENGTWLKAPNGKDTNLTPKQWVDVRTSRFKSWFGDWENDPENASKVVDENGEPLVMYHGSNWKPNNAPKNEGVFKMREGALGKGAYFTSVFAEAADYARAKIGRTELTEDEIEEGKYVTEAFLNIRDIENIWPSKYGQGGLNAVATEPNQIKSATENTGEYSPANDDIRMSIEAYHGSGVGFEKFDHSFMSTGEGAQAYGWGSYVSSVEGIARTYADTMREKAISDKHRENAIINRMTKELLESRGGDKEQAIKELRYLLNQSWSDKKRVKAQIKIIETGRYLPETKKKAHLYTVEVPDNTGDNYLSWSEESTLAIKDRLYSYIEYEINNRIDKIYFNSDKGKLNEEERREYDAYEIKLNEFKKSKDFTGEEIYGFLTELLGSPKAASEFLHSIGFTGIEYPAQYTTGGRADGAKNYVIFNADDVKIVDHVQYFKTPNGEVYGFVYEDKIYLDPTNIDPKAPVHEYTELWCREVAKANEALWKRGKELVKQTKVWEEVNADENYKNLDEDLRASEAWSRIIADEMMGKARQYGSKGLMAKLRGWLRSFWKTVKSVVEKWTKKDLDDLTVDQFKKMTMADFINKVDPRKWNAKKPKEVSKSLVGIHNISLDKLQKALKQGGLANPSAAVIDIAKQNHEGYGEYSLIMPKSLVDATSGRNAGTFTGDAWTPTYPTIVRQLDTKGWEIVKNKISTAVGDSKELYADIVNGVRNFLEDNRSSKLEYVFLKEKGIEPEIVYKGADGFVSIANLEAILGVSNITEGIEAYERYKKSDNVGKWTFNRWARTNGEKAEFAKLKALIKESPALKEEFHADLSFAQFDSFVNDIYKKEREAGNIDTSNTLLSASIYVDKNGLREEFESWIDTLMESAEAKEVFYAGIDRNGDRIYKPNTLENVSRHMLTEGMQNAYNNGGLSATKATLLQRLTTLSEIRQNKDRLSDEGKYNKEFDKLSDRLFNIITAISDMQEISSNRFMNIDYAELRLQDALAKKDPIAYLNKEYGYDIAKDSDLAKEIKSFIGDVRKMPAKYFETKFERPVMFNEFAAVVAPDTMPESVEQQLRDAGLAIYKYNPDVEGDRRKATLAATASEDIRFMIIGEKGAAALDQAEEATTRLDNLAVAREMEEANRDAKAIKLATGWERGADGKWRYEIPDFKLKSDTALVKNVDNQIVTTLGEVIVDEALFTAFPELRKLSVVSLPNQEYGGHYQDGSIMPHIALGNKLFTPSTKRLVELEKEFDKDMTSEQEDALMSEFNAEVERAVAQPEFYTLVTSAAKKVLVHEVQHAIQRIEGFARGGSWEIERPDNDAEMLRLRDAVRGARAYLDHFKGDDIAMAIRDGKKYNYLEWRSISPESQQILLEYLGRKRKVNYADFRAYLDNAHKMTLPKQYGMSGYRKFAGEVESKNAEARMYMTPEERRATLLSETEDVAREDQIFLESNLGVAQSVEVSEPVEVPTRKPRKSAAEKSLEKIDSLREQLQNKKRSLENTLADVYNFLTSKDIAETMAEGVGKAQYRSVIKNAIEAIGKAYNITDVEEKRKVVFRYLGEIDDNLSQMLTRQRLNEVTEILDKAIYGYTAQGVRTGKRIDEHTREIFDMLRNAIAEPVEEERDERGYRKPVHYRLKNRTEAGDITSSFRLRTQSSNDVGVIAKLRSDADEIINSVDYLDTATTRKAAQLEYTANLLEKYDNTLQLNEAIGKSTDEITQILDNIDRVREKYKAAAVGSEERKNFYDLLKQLKTDLESEKMNRANLRHRYASMLKIFTTSLEQLDKKGASEFVRAEEEKAEAAIKWRKGVYDSIKNPNAPVLPFGDYDRKGKKQEINWKGLNTRAKINESAFMATFAEMSRDIDINSIPGQWLPDGWYYQFMLAPGGYMERTDWRYKTEKALREELDAEVLKLSGDKKADEPYKLFAQLAQEPSGMTIQRMAVSTNKEGKVVGGYQENIPLTIGQLLYMRNTLRQPNGFAGYNAWGFSETYMQNIVEYVEAKYPQYCRFFDWVVSEFMPKLYDMQDAIYFKKFGTHLPKTAFYFPFVRDKRMVGKVAEVGEGEVSLPSSVTGNIVERVKTSAKMDLEADAFSVLQDHIKETLDWCAYVELTDKFNSVGTSHAFGNMLKAQGVSVQKLKEMYEVAVGQGKINSTDNTTLTKTLNAISKGLVAGNIVLNPNAAIKQIVSATATLGYSANPKLLAIWAKNFFVPSVVKTGIGKVVQQIKRGEINPVEAIDWKVIGDNWKWAIENIPTLRERWEGREAGFEVLKSHSFDSWDKLTAMITNAGLAPNAFVDMLTCSNAAKTVYEYEYPRLLERGRSKKEAHREACVKAAIFINETQQSSLNGFLSSFQSGGGLQRILGVGLGAYQNSSMAFARNERFALTNMLRMANSATRNDMQLRQVAAYKELGVEDAQAVELAKQDIKESYGQQVSGFVHNGVLNNYIWKIAGVLLGSLTSAGFAAMFDKDEWNKLWKNEKFRQELASAVSAETLVWQTPLLYNAPITKQILEYSHNVAVGKAYGGIFEAPTSQSAQDLIDAIFKQWIGVKNEVTGERERKEPTRYDRSAEWLVTSTLVKAGLGVNPDLVVRMAQGIDDMMKDGVQVEDVMATLSSPRGLTRAIAGEPRQGEAKEEYLARMAYIYRQINAQDKKFVRERTKEYIDNKDNELYRTLGIVPREERILEQKVKAIRKQLLFFDRSDEGVAEFRALPEADRKKQIEIAKRYDKITKLTKEMYQGILPFDEAGVSKRKQELQKRHDMMREVYDMWIEYNNK